METDEARALRELDEINTERKRLADERHTLLTAMPRPEDADARLAQISGRQADLAKKADGLLTDYGRQ